MKEAGFQEEAGSSGLFLKNKYNSQTTLPHMTISSKVQ